MNDELAPRRRKPRLVIEIGRTGPVVAVIRGARDERGARPFRAWLDDDPEMRELVALARTIRDRRGAK